MDYNCNKIEIKVKSELKINGVNEVVIVSDQSLSIFVRQLAVHADVIIIIPRDFFCSYTNFLISVGSYYSQFSEESLYRSVRFELATEVTTVEESPRKGHSRN